MAPVSLFWDTNMAARHVKQSIESLLNKINMAFTAFVAYLLEMDFRRVEHLHTFLSHTMGFLNELPGQKKNDKCPERGMSMLRID